MTTKPEHRSVMRGWYETDPHPRPGTFFYVDTWTHPEYVPPLAEEGRWVIGVYIRSAESLLGAPIVGGGGLTRTILGWANYPDSARRLVRSYETDHETLIETLWCWIDSVSNARGMEYRLPPVSVTRADVPWLLGLVNERPE